MVCSYEKVMLAYLICMLMIGCVNCQLYIRCSSNLDCSYGEFCDMSLGKPPICSPCIDCDRFNRHPGEVKCVSYVLADCGPCLYGYKDTSHYNPAMRLEKCERDPNIRNRSVQVKSSLSMITLAIFGCFVTVVWERL